MVARRSLGPSVRLRSAALRRGSGAAALLETCPSRRLDPLRCHLGAAALTAFRNEMLIGLLAPVLIGTYFPWKRRLDIVASVRDRTPRHRGVGQRPFLPTPRGRMALSRRRRGVPGRTPHRRPALQHLRIWRLSDLEGPASLSSTAGRSAKRFSRITAPSSALRPTIRRAPDY
jgi:hypothetical protein